jgi:hypothetical protein
MIFVLNTTLHSLAKPCRNHTTIPISEYRKLPSYVLEINELCKEHQEKFNLYCKEHERPCCRICIRFAKLCWSKHSVQRPSSQSEHQTSDGLEIWRISHIPQKDGELDMMLISCNKITVVCIGN